MSSKCTGGCGYVVLEGIPPTSKRGEKKKRDHDTPGVYIFLRVLIFFRHTPIFFEHFDPKILSCGRFILVFINYLCMYSLKLQEKHEHTRFSEENCEIKRIN